MSRAFVSGVQQLTPNWSRLSSRISSQLLIRIFGRSLVNFGELIVGPVTGSASNMIRIAVPFFRLPGGFPAASPTVAAEPPGTAADDRKRMSGPEYAPLVASGSTMTQPFASGIWTDGGTGPMFTFGGPSTGTGGGLMEPPAPAITIDWNLGPGPKPKSHPTRRVPTSIAYTAAPANGT